MIVNEGLFTLLYGQTHALENFYLLGKLTLVAVCYFININISV